MRRVVVTGMGIVSCLGQDLDTVSKALREGRSGIGVVPEYAERGFRSHLAGKPGIEPSELIDRKLFRFMGDAAAYAWLSMRDAIAHAGLDEQQVSNERTGLIAGSGGGSSRYQVETADIVRDRGVRKVGPYMVTRTMTSTVSACLATPFHIRGVNYSIGSACATSAHCIGNAMEQIQLGKQDIVFAGGGEELDWSMTAMFDAMGALSKRNDDPQHASRAYDRDRDGFVIAAGGGMLVLEELEHAKARGANILAEIVGYGATSDGYDMVAPSGEGAARCMKMAMQNVDGVDYINTHGTSTPAGDVAELKAIRDVFGDNTPAFSSTKSLSGHSLGAAGVQEAIYSLLMLRDDFLAGSANIENLDPQAEGLPVLLKTENRKVNRVMSNSFGFGGTNACLVFERYNG